MRILHVIPALTKGGAERVAIDLANQSMAAGHRVSLVAAYPVDPQLLQKDLDPKIDIRFVRQRKSRLGAYLSAFAWIARNREFLADQEVVHCHLTFGSVFGDILQRRIGTNTRPAVVETYHAVGMAIPAWKRWLHAHLLRRRDAVALMATDPYWRIWQSARRPNIVKIIPNGIVPRPPPSAERIEAYRRKACLPSDAFMIGSVGRLLHERRPDMLVKAFACAVAALPENAHLVLGGEGPERPRLLSLAASLGIADRVHLPGLVHEPGELLAHLRIYLTVNVGQTSGIAAIEAAQNGLPIVAYQMVTDYQPDPDDWIWSSSEASAMGQQLSQLATDGEARHALAARQKAYARQHHSAGAMALAYHALYKAAVNNKGSSKRADQ